MREKIAEQGLPSGHSVSAFILMLCLVFFAFTTILGWDYYSGRCLEYLTDGKRGVVKAYRWLYIHRRDGGENLLSRFVYRSAKEIFRSANTF